MGEPVLEHLLQDLSNQGIKQAIVCSNDDTSLNRDSIACAESMEVKFLNEQLPAGTAGCIRDAIGDETKALFLVFHAGIVSLPSIDTLIRLHHAGQSDLTIMFEPDLEDGKPTRRASGIYVCEPSILKYIPKKGYCDIKETLIPTMLSKGGSVHGAVLDSPSRSFRNRTSYLAAMAGYLENSDSVGFAHQRWNGSANVWVADSAEVDPSAHVYGPVVIMDGAKVLEEAVVLGPTIVEQNVIVGESSLVENSVLWNGSSVGRNSEVHDCVVDYKAVVPDNLVVANDVVTYQGNNQVEINVSRSAAPLRKGIGELPSAVRWPINMIFEGPGFYVLTGLAASVLIGLFLWSYWSSFSDLWNIWQRSDEYSSGILVPFLAVYVLWSRRRDIANCPIRASAWGLFAFLAAQGVRLLGLLLMYGSLEMLSLTLSIAALVLLFFGWRLFRKVSTVLLFLCLMLPWPKQVEAKLAIPLQRWATSSAVFCLQLIGYEVAREGNIIHVGATTVGVDEACNGLRMVTAFVVISSLVALLVKRSWWEKLIVLASSVPIALVCNTVRLTITAIACTMFNHENLVEFFHDFGGYAMMPLALAGIVAELWLLTKLTTPPGEQERMVVIRQKWRLTSQNKNERELENARSEKTQQSGSRTKDV
jgi:exosortase